MLTPAVVDLLGEIEQVCSHVAVMSEGSLVAHGSLEELRGGTSARLVLEVSLVTAAKKVLRTFGITPITATRVGSTSRLIAPVDSSLDVGAVNTALVSAGVAVSSLPAGSIPTHSVCACSIVEPVADAL